MDLITSAKMAVLIIEKPPWFIPDLKRLLLAIAQVESAGGRQLGPRFEAHIFDRLQDGGRFIGRSKRDLELLASSHGAWQVMGYRACELGFEPTGEFDWIAFLRVNELNAFYAAKYLQRFVFEHTVAGDVLKRIAASPGPEEMQVKTVGYAYNGNPNNAERPAPRVAEYGNRLWSAYCGVPQ